MTWKKQKNGAGKTAYAGDCKEFQMTCRALRVLAVTAFRVVLISPVLQKQEESYEE